jgi:hypothetical protein
VLVFLQNARTLLRRPLVCQTALAAREKRAGSAEGPERNLSDATKRSAALARRRGAGRPVRLNGTAYCHKELFLRDINRQNDFPPNLRELNRIWFRVYECFRPEIKPEERDCLPAGIARSAFCPGGYSASRPLQLDGLKQSGRFIRHISGLVLQYPCIPESPAAR